MLPVEDLINCRGLLALNRSNRSLLEKSSLIDGTQWTIDFSFDQIKKLAQYMGVFEVGPRTVLFPENEKQAYLVLIAKGRVDVVKFDSSRLPKKITTLGPGKTIGEMSLIDGEPRSAAAVTATDATLLVMTADDFDRLNRDLPGIGILLVLKIAKQMSQYLRQTSGRLIDHLGA
ncbi:MAG: cyclic nucleotide-binding domain-containing protein [Desulfobacterales bacterium]